MSRGSVVAGGCLALFLLAGGGEAYGTSTANRSDAVINVYDDTGLSSDTDNDITVTLAGPSYLLSDLGGMENELGSDCSQSSPTEVSCPVAGSDYLSATLFGGDDRLVLPTDSGWSNSSAFLGPGEDFLQGGDEATQADGQGGNDLIYLGGGDDKSVHGGPGDDRIYGEAGNDDVLGDRNSLDESGDAGDDLLDGGEGHDLLDGDHGSDTLLGGPDADILQDCASLGPCGPGTPPPVRVFDTLIGGDGDDVLLAGLGGDILDGGPGGDVIQATGGTALGGNGNDEMSATGGSYTLPGRDPVFLGDASTLEGGDGDDLLRGRTPAPVPPDGRVSSEQVSDVLDCGEGSVDRVVPGPGDLVGIDCEFVYETITCDAFSCEGNISVVAPPPPSARGKGKAGAKRVVLAEKTFELRRGERSKAAKMSRRAVKSLLRNRTRARVTKTVELSSGGRKARRTERTKTRYKLAK